ncbi:MAG: sulfite exporter TauE/SafE family protein [Thermoleophilia bacterium]|nr:sulfite exporter TauE/SafE family protein [Thermoleophilia bacterium]
MSATTIALALVLGAAAGVLSGLFGVGGGILFVPALVALGLGQVEAAATSLLAIIPTAAVGVVRHRARGTVRVRAAVIIGVTSILGAFGGVELAQRLDEDMLRRLFGLLLLAVAAQLVVRALRRP